MQFKESILDPVFLFKKRAAVVNRLKEMPKNLLWRIKALLVLKGLFSDQHVMALMALKDIHKGKSCILVGNGPSVSLEELEKANGQENFISFAANRFYLCFDETTFRPDFLISSDEQMIDDFGSEMLEHMGGQLFFSSLRAPTQFLHNSNSFIWVKLFNGRPFRFSKNLPVGLMSGGGSLIAALQIAYHMGIRKFYMYGVDHNFNFQKNEGSDSNKDAVGEGNHFIKNYRSDRPWHSPRVDLIEQSFKECDRILREEGGFLINATNGGKLEVLERRDFASLFSKNRSAS